MPQKGPVYETTFKERVAYPMFGFGQNMVYGLVSGYLSLFYTDHLFIPALTVSAIFLVAKVWDAVNDPLFGLLVDRVQFKNGKFKPWLRISTIAIPLTTLALFGLSPGMPLPLRIVLAVVTYLLWDIAYTISDVPGFSLLTAMTGNVQERSVLLSRGSVSGMLCGILLIVVLAPQIETIGFAPVALIAAILSFAGMLPLTLFAKERNRTQQKEEDKPGLKDILVYLRGNKYLAIFFAANITSGVLNISMSLNNYIMIYFFGGLDFLARLTVIGIGPLILLYLFLPKLTARFDRMVMYRVSVIAALILNILIFFIGPGNLVVYGTLAIVKTIIATPQGMLAFTFTMDCVEYGHYKTGQRREGITTSVQAFMNKFNSAVSASLALFILSLTGYKGELAIQTPVTLNAMWTANYWVPIIGMLLSLPLLFRYTLKSRDVQIMADINAGKTERAAGEAAMARTY